MSSIQLKWMAALSALVAVVVLAAGYQAERGLRERETRIVERSLRERAELVGELIAGRALIDANSAELAGLTARVGAKAGARVTLIAADGTVVADSEVEAARLAALENHAGRPEVAAALEGRVGRDTRLSRSVGRPFLYLGIPYAGGGAVRLAVDLAFLDAEVAELRRQLWIGGAIGIAVAVALAYAVSSWALRRVRGVAGVVEDLASGHLERRVEWNAENELGAIARAVNDMADQLQGRLRDLTGEKEQLEAVLAAMVEGVLVIDADATIVLANPRVRDLFDVWGEVEGRPHWEVLRRKEVEDALESAATQTEPVVREVRTDEPDARVVEMHAVRFPSLGALAGIVAVFHDITEIRRLEGIRRDFVANVSHELKTPLTAIRGFAETLQANHIPPDQRRSYLDVILRHSDRLGRLIEDVLELSRIEGGRQELLLAEVDVGTLCAALLRDMAPQLAKRELRADLESPGPTVAWADRRAVEQVLLNLLDNAAKYSEPGGRIQVRLRTVQGQVRVEVEDDGIGIPDEDRPRIFERFYRVDRARSRDLGGTGLGLAIVKHLVQSLGGDVFVESRPGVGSTFSFTLPTHR